MLELTKIAGDTYTITVESGSVLGVYIFPDQTCLLIDTTLKRRNAQKVYQFLLENNLYVIGIMNTHAHADHIGGNKYIQDNTGCAIYARPQEAIYITYPVLKIQALYTAALPREINNSIDVVEAAKVTDYIEPGSIIIKNRLFQVLDLAGHSIEHCGFVTPDGVAFVGDALIGEEILQGFPYIYILDLAQYFKSLDYLAANVNGPVVAGHGGLIADINKCRVKNLNLVKEILEQYQLILSSQAMSREEMVRETIRTRIDTPTHIQYYMFFSTVSAYLAYLTEQKTIRSIIKDGVMRYKSYPVTLP